MAVRHEQFAADGDAPRAGIIDAHGVPRHGRDGRQGFCISAEIVGEGGRELHAGMGDEQPRPLLGHATVATIRPTQNDVLADSADQKDMLPP